MAGTERRRSRNGLMKSLSCCLQSNKKGKVFLFTSAVYFDVVGACPYEGGKPSLRHRAREARNDVSLLWASMGARNAQNGHFSSWTSGETAEIWPIREKDGLNSKRLSRA